MSANQGDKSLIGNDSPGSSRIAFRLLPPGTAPDAGLLLATRAVRGFGDGMATLLLPLYLTALGHDAAAIGLLSTAALLGSAVLVWLLGSIAHRHDIRRLLIGATLLTVGTGLAFASLEELWPLLLVAAIGTLTPTAGDVSLFLPLEQSLLAGAAPPRHRTALFARYAFVSSLAVALGSLLGGTGEALATLLGMELLTVLRGMFVLYAGLGVACALLYARLRPPAPEAAALRPATALGPSRGVVWRLSALFAVDSLGSGFFVQSLFAVWLIGHFGVDPAAAGAIFFWAGLMNALSYFAAPALAARIGLVNTMVFTHIPANLCVIALPFVDDLAAAVVLMLVRGLLSNMDVPTRTSYVMAVVTPAERPAAASFTALPRSLATAAAPWLSGLMLAATPFGWPLVIGGTLKIAYDLALLALFRGVKPPEER